MHGDLTGFDNPEDQLPTVDRFKGLCPGRPGVYRHVMVTVNVAGARNLAWVHAIGVTGVMPHRIMSGHWRE